MQTDKCKLQSNRHTLGNFLCAHTKRNTECNKIFEFDTAETKFIVTITAS